MSQRARKIFQTRLIPVTWEAPWSSTWTVAGPPLPCGCNLVVPLGTTHEVGVSENWVVIEAWLRKDAHNWKWCLDLSLRDTIFWVVCVSEFLDLLSLGGPNHWRFMPLLNVFQVSEIFDVFEKRGSRNRGSIQEGKSTTWDSFAIWRILTWRFELVSWVNNVLFSELTSWVNKSWPTAPRVVVLLSATTQQLGVEIEPTLRTSPANFPGYETWSH